MRPRMEMEPYPRAPKLYPRAPAPAAPLRVLIVDDNEDHSQLAIDYLQLAGSFAAEIAPSLRELWACLARSTYDVVLLDYNLPDGNGLQALAELPKRGYAVPVVMVTGRGDERIAAQAIQHGAIDYLVKTGDYLRTLPALVEKAVRTHQLKLTAQRSLEHIRYQALLLDHMRDAVVVWDPEGRITFWNRAAEALFGWSATERVGRSVAECYYSMFVPQIELTPVNGGSWSDLEAERKCAGAAGEAVWISSRITLLRDSAGACLGYMDVSRDITARVQLETRVRSAQMQLVQAARLAAIGELASGVAHQISNPLTTVIGEAQLLVQQLPAPHPARESADAIQQAGWRAQAAVQRLMEFSRPPTGSLSVHSVNLSLRHALDLVGADIQATGVKLQVSLAEDVPGVRGNARQLEDLWVNLLLVEREAIPDSRPRCIRLQSERGPEETVVVRVSDDGLPIPSGRLADLFEPDFVGPTYGRGSGLALSICREIVRQLNGQISVESVPERGTLFTVVLPGEAQP